MRKQGYHTGGYVKNDHPGFLMGERPEEYSVPRVRFSKITTFVGNRGPSIAENRIPVILDVDDVLLDWSASFLRYANWKYRAKPVKEQPDSWHLSEYFGVASEVIHEWVKDFNSSPHFCDLAALPGAKHAVSHFAKNGHPIFAVSSCWGNMQTPILRQTNLFSHFGNVFSEIMCLPLGADKTPYLAGIADGIWVEDNYTNAVAGHAAGHKTFMMRRPHNRSLESSSIPEIEWIDSWKPVIDCVQKSRLK